MKYRLDSEHYIDDKLIPAGVEIGDGTDTPFRFAKDLPDGTKSGHAMTPSLNMTPLDDEARKIYKETFGKGKPDVDPTKAIPLRGTLDTARTATPRPPEPRPSPPRADLPQFNPPLLGTKEK